MKAIFLLLIVTGTLLAAESLHEKRIAEINATLDSAILRCPLGVSRGGFTYDVLPASLLPLIESGDKVFILQVLKDRKRSREQELKELARKSPGTTYWDPQGTYDATVMSILEGNGKIIEKGNDWFSVRVNDSIDATLP